MNDIVEGRNSVAKCRKFYHAYAISSEPQTKSGNSSKAMLANTSNCRDLLYVCPLLYMAFGHT